MASPPRLAQQFNKVAVRVAGHRHLPWAALHHRGRRSGKEYTTPVAPVTTDSTFVIPLAWGRDTDWVRNIEAAGGCTIRWKGVTYECTAPTFVDKDVALAAATGLMRRGIERREFPHGFLQLDRRATS